MLQGANGKFIGSHGRSGRWRRRKRAIDGRLRDFSEFAHGGPKSVRELAFVLRIRAFAKRAADISCIRLRVLPCRIPGDI